MKVRFLQARYKLGFEIPLDFVKNVREVFGEGKRIALYSAVQFLGNLSEVRGVLQNAGFEVVSSRPDRAFSDSQILGCDSYAHNFNIDLGEVDGFVYVGDGFFHPNALLFAQEGEDMVKPVVVLNAREGRVEVFGREVVERYFKKRKGNLLKFYTSLVVGVFVSSKWGQEFKDSALKLKEMYPEKEFYFFAGDNFMDSEMENFNFAQCWVNTACPRIGQDDVLRHARPVVNIADVWKLSFK